VLVSRALSPSSVVASVETPDQGLTGDSFGARSPEANMLTQPLREPSSSTSCAATASIAAPKRSARGAVNRPSPRPTPGTNFKKGFGVATFGRKSLRKVGNFYRDNAGIIEAHREATLDFDTGLATQRRYTRAKVIDMIFFIEGMP
jgi:hypothetical protein